MFGSSIITAIINLVSSAVGTIGSFFTFSSPIIKVALDAIVWFVTKFKTALAVIISNLVVLYAIVPLMIGANIYGSKVAYKKCTPKVVKELRVKYKFVEKKPSKNLAPAIDFTNPLSWWK